MLGCCSRTKCSFPFQWWNGPLLKDRCSSPGTCLNTPSQHFIEFLSFVFVCECLTTEQVQFNLIMFLGSFQIVYCVLICNRERKCKNNGKQKHACCSISNSRCPFNGGCIQHEASINRRNDGRTIRYCCTSWSSKASPRSQWCTCTLQISRIFLHFAQGNA